ncbi:hypothetical protein ACF0H5_020342 [Mactra antiquata]
MKLFLLFGGLYFVLIRHLLADAIGVNLEDRFRKFVTEIREQDVVLRSRLRILETERQVRDRDLQDRLRKFETEMHEKDREIQLLQDQINGTLEKIIDKIFTETNNISEEISVSVTAEEIGPNEQQDIELNSQNDISPRAVAGTVAFYAYMRTTGTAVCFKDHETIVFDTVVTDISGSYNNRDGIFDAPVTGAYTFAITVVPVSYHWVSFEIVADGTVLGGAVGDSEGIDSHNSGSVTVVVHLQAGAHVYVRRGGGSTECATGSWTSFVTLFAGWLIG